MTDKLTFKADFSTPERESQTVGVIKVVLPYRRLDASFFLGDASCLAMVQDCIKQGVYLGELDGKHSNVYMEGAVATVCTDPEAVSAFQVLASLGLKGFGPVSRGMLLERLAESAEQA